MIYTIDEISRRIQPVASAYGLQAVYLFGSYARGEATENSDIDLLIDTSGTNLRSLFSLGKLYCDLESALEKKIDLITLSSLEQTTRLPSDELFRNNIEKEKVKLYDGDYQRSIAFSILQIGELGGSLSEAYRKETCNRIQWGPIKGMRNMVAHSYGSMSREIIWETATMDIPVLLNFCEEQLKEK